MTDYLSASIADPSSNSSSTIFIAESFFDSLLAESRDLFLKERRSLSLFRFGGGGVGGNSLSGGIMSTTMQVVSSFNPLVLSASCITVKIYIHVRRNASFAT